MVLKRWEVCQVLGVNSWTAVMAWLDDVVSPAFVELIRDYLAPFAARGERSPPGDVHVKEYFVRFADELSQRVDWRVSELEGDVLGCLDKDGWDIRRHYEHFTVDAVAMDRLSARRSPEKKHLTTKDWAQDPVKLFANMYELTEAICHNYWKPAETEFWPSDDSDVPYTDGEDVPGVRL